MLDIFSFCNGEDLCAARSARRSLAEAVPASSPLWDALLRRSGAWLGSCDRAPSMIQASRLAQASARCQLLLRHEEVDESCCEPTDRQHRHRLIITGARDAGISTLVRMICGLQPCEPCNQDMHISSLRAQLAGTRLTVSVVDKRCTAISTPLSANLYRGHTASLFVFDAGRPDTLRQAANCIKELQETVGLRKFEHMPKLLICHKADLLPPQAEGFCQDMRARALSFPAEWRALVEAYSMDFIFTSRHDAASAELALALAAKNWPRAEPDILGQPLSGASVKQHLKKVQTVVRRHHPVGRVLPSQQGAESGHRSVARRLRAPGDLLAELRAVVRRVE
eukprot:TRINITY_DN17929_c0_g1_i1.p1 TRINITY_DN17929_c0_g1~~TRINITY_DN17929_c0_g1_i1.p1  ORF type:complete len:371 (-),score=70.26 TRINITY_DN17929_c0_g1_i1:30-1043(-)